ncbi:hypothetical protein [Streptomyces sp. CA-106131]|uniref:hypothetical protein n=1 Tax=Streptomyces sp. CA-106131 TaxID=3240045 RepID=UPI003D930BC1
MPFVPTAGGAVAEPVRVRRPTDQSAASTRGGSLAELGSGNAVASARSPNRSRNPRGFVLPIRSTDVVRRRAADALLALRDVLGGARTGTADLGPSAARFDHSLERLVKAAPPLEAHRRLVQHRLVRSGRARGGPPGRTHRRAVGHAVSGGEVVALRPSAYRPEGRSATCPRQG